MNGLRPQVRKFSEKLYRYLSYSPTAAFIRRPSQSSVECKSTTKSPSPTGATNKFHNYTFIIVCTYIYTKSSQASFSSSNRTFLKRGLISPLRLFFEDLLVPDAGFNCSRNLGTISVI